MLVKHAESITLANGGMDRWGWTACGSLEIVALHSFDGSTPAVPFNIGETSFLAVWDLLTSRYDTGSQAQTLVHAGYTVAALGAQFDGTSANTVSVSLQVVQQCAIVLSTMVQQPCATQTGLSSCPFHLLDSHDLIRAPTLQIRIVYSGPVGAQIRSFGITGDSGTNTVYCFTLDGDFNLVKMALAPLTPAGSSELSSYTCTLDGTHSGRT